MYFLTPGWIIGEQTATENRVGSGRATRSRADRFATARSGTHPLSPGSHCYEPTDEPTANSVDSVEQSEVVIPEIEQQEKIFDSRPKSNSSVRGVGSLVIDSMGVAVFG